MEIFWFLLFFCAFFLIELKAFNDHDGGFGYSITHQNHFVGSGGGSDVNPSSFNLQTPPWRSSIAIQPQWTFNGYNHDSYSVSYVL